MSTAGLVNTGAVTRFHLHPSPIGDILIVTTAEGIVTLHPVHGEVDAELQNLAQRLGSTPEHDETEAATAAASQLDEYFSGARTEFDLPLDWRLVRGFTRAALEAVCDIPYGETAGYGEVAITAGRPRAARAVGTACATTPFSIVVPVHRVVRSDGSLGEYGGHPEVKKFLVDLEQAKEDARADE
ncbi:methylated-DNA--[protein]-cysteine S-methyltransferase [Microbacterium pumilum]|uniref:Methylated-DNA--[protein]-cysteine S-methyltransferase n=1 Tax=Microbacterium pumilum TaxID=344165 RepID=A0ABN2SXT5_9MICO